MSDKFRYTYSAPTDAERREIERIRREYVPDSHGEKMTRLRTLHARVRNVPMALAVTLGVAGLLLFGLGMSMVLAWDLFLAGSAVAAAGCVPMALAYPVYSAVLRAMKKRYGGEILRLSDELLHADGKPDGVPGEPPRE